MFKSIKTRIILGIMLVSFIVYVITNAIIWDVFKRSLKNYIADDMEKIKSIAFKEVEQQYMNYTLEDRIKAKDKLLPVLNAINKGYGCYISIDEDENNNVAFTGRLLNETHKRNILMESSKRASILYMEPVSEGFHGTFTYPMFINNEYRGTLVIQQDYWGEYSNYRRIMLQIVAVEAILYIIMLGIIFLWLAKMTRSLRDLSEGMKLVGEGNYTKELAVPGRDEISDLAEHFNRMQDKIKKQMEQLYIEKKRTGQLERETKDFFNYATHEMKTPITAIKGYGELLEQGKVEEDTKGRIYSRIILEADRINNLIKNMLIVAKGRGNIEQIYETFNVRILILEMREELELVLEKEGIQIDVNIGDAEISAVKEEVRAVFKNLMENGIKYSRDKRVYIENKNNNPLCILVRNSIHPIPQRLREHLLEPFVKYNYGEMERVSSGLGLFICSELLDKNNGKITYKINEDEICFAVEFFKKEN